MIGPQMFETLINPFISTAFSLSLIVFAVTPIGSCDWSRLSTAISFISRSENLILMEFWGIEVKPGQTVKCEPGIEKVLHLSQASLGEIKKEKGGEHVPIFVNVNNQKLVLGTLSADKCAQIQYDLVFEKEFELSHGSKNTSVFFVGYRTIYQGYESEDDFSDSDSEEGLAAAKKAITLGNSSKIASSKGTAEKKTFEKADNNMPTKSKAKMETNEGIKDDKKAEDKDDDDDDEDDSEEESDEDEDVFKTPGDDSSNDDEDESSEEDDTPKKKLESVFKRKADSASKIPIPEKKAKHVAPAGNQKTGGDGKKSVRVATPYPSKQGGKPRQSPKSIGTIVCKSCDRSFVSETALQAHNKAKHAAAAK